MPRALFVILAAGLLLAGVSLTGRAAGRAAPAPELTGGGRWFNTPGETPLTLAALRGKVVLVEFWTGG